MKIVFSRKGFDSSSGGYPSPIIDGTPVSLPIPTNKRSVTTYEDLGLGDIVEQITKRRLRRFSFCHYDPMFENGRCAFGQTGAAQSHLKNNGIVEGDTFLFFGLFSKLDGTDRHHRIFGYLRVDSIQHLGPTPQIDDQPKGFSVRHPHTIGIWNPNNTLYVGKGHTAGNVTRTLCLSRSNTFVSHWKIPTWLRSTGLTYHGRSDRWQADDTLIAASRGQEFISDISGNAAAELWVDEVITAIHAVVHDGENSDG